MTDDSEDFQKMALATLRDDVARTTKAIAVDMQNTTGERAIAAAVAGAGAMTLLGLSALTFATLSVANVIREARK